MRKIEKNLLLAIRAKKTYWADSNTMICHDNLTNTYNIFLHGNKIASIDYVNQVLKLSSCGWKTPTTKSRLNTILDALSINKTIKQENGAWIIKGKQNRDFYDNIEMFIN